MKAFVTLLSNRQYLDGVKVLYRSLRATGTQYPLFCLLSRQVDEATRHEIECEGISCVRLAESVVSESVNTRSQTFSHWNYTFDKLQVWGLDNFEKVMFLDSDMLILRNIDHLFDCDTFSAVCAGRSYPGHDWWDNLNSGLMVIRPDKHTFRELADLTQLVIKKFQERNQCIGDQDVLHQYIPDWWHRTQLHLDEGYNMLADYLTYYVRHLGYSLNESKAGKPVYVVHFIGKLKPWMKPTLRGRLWLLRNFLYNPYYFLVYWKFRKYMKL